MRRAAQAIKKNGKAAAVFELLYKMAAIAVLVPLLFGSFALAMRWSGYSYLTHENILRFLARPVTWLAAAVDLLAGAVWLMGDVSAVVFLLDQSAQGVRVTPAQVLRFAAKNTARVLRGKNVLLVPMTLTAVPLVHLGFLAVLLTAVSVPAPVADLLERVPALPLSAAAGAAVLTALGVRWMYGIVCFTLEGRSLREARKKCARLGRGRRLKDAAVMMAAQAAFAAVFTVLLLIATALAGALGELLARIAGLEWIGSYAVWAAIVLTLTLAAALAVPAGYGCAAVLCRRAAARRGEALGHTAAPDMGIAPRSRWRRALAGAGAAAVVCGGLAMLFLLGTGRINPDVEYLHTMEITAHRGASALYPENTMAAFSGAAELGADWVELDVQQSRDGQLVVAHDANLNRVTGVNAYVWDLTYEQLAALDAGAGFGEAFAGERIPLLSEALAFAGENGIKLNIELKPTGHETDMEQAVVDAIHEAGLEDSCVVTSQSYQVLEKVKAYDETITTVYVMRFIYGNIGSLSAADHFSVDAVSVTRSLVKRVHNAGKQLYVWTVNSRRSIEKMISLNVDNIITDDVDLAKQCVYESRYSDMLEGYIDLLQ